MTALKKVEKIVARQGDMPIYHSEYLKWVMGIATLPAKRQNEIRDFIHNLYSFCDEDWISDLVKFEINGEPLTFDSVHDLELKEASKAILNKEFSLSSSTNLTRTFERQLNETPIISSKAPVESAISQYIDMLGSLKTKAISSGNVSFYYHSVPIEESMLFEDVEESGKHYRIIRPSLLPYLRFLDLSDISFARCLIEGIDLSLTNIANLDINQVFERNARNANLEGVILSPTTIKNGILDGANLTDAYPWIDITSTTTTGATIDDTATLLNGEQIIRQAKSKTIEKTPITLHF